MTYDYDKFFEKKLKLIAEKSRTILDVGGGRPFQKIVGRHKNILDGKKYITLDIDPGTRRVKTKKMLDKEKNILKQAWVSVT